MSKQLLSIDGFKEAIVNDETTQANKGFVDMIGLDPWSEDGILQINKRLIADTTTSLTEKPLSNATFGGKTLAGMSGAEIWYENTTDIWTLLHTNSLSGDNDDLVVYQNYLIYASNTKLGRSTNTTIAGGFTDSPTWGSGTLFTNSSGERYFKNFNNRLYITDGQYLAELDGATDPSNPSTWIFTAEKFTLPMGEVMTTLEVTGGELAIGTESGTFYMWDGASANASTRIPTQLGGITAMINVENTLFVFAGISGTIYRYNGADLVPEIQIPRFNISAVSFVRKTGVRRYKNGFIFGISKNGIYVFNRIKKKESFGLNKYGNLSGGRVIDSFEGTIYSIYIVDQSSSDDRFLVGYLYNSVIGIDKPHPSNRYRMEEAGGGDDSASPLLETYVYELRDKNGKPNKIQGLQGLFKDDGINVENNIKVYYRLENTVAYTELGSIGEDGVDINKILRGIGKRVNKAQLKILIGRETTNETGVRNTKLIGLKIF